MWKFSFILGSVFYISTPLIIVLHQEIDQFNHLLSLIIQSLCELQQGTKGKIMFTKDQEQLYNSLLKGEVPDLWQVREQSCGKNKY